MLVADRVTDLGKLALECQRHHSNACGFIIR